jgi:hypothetical protein
VKSKTTSIVFKKFKMPTRMVKEVFYQNDNAASLSLAFNQVADQVFCKDSADESNQARIKIHWSIDVTSSCKGKILINRKRLKPHSPKTAHSNPDLSRIGY